jgi:hypothetical protein
MRIRRAAVAAGVLIPALALGGCATTENGPTGEFARASHDTASAMQAALLVFEQHQDGSTTDAATGTTLGDMLTAVTQAESETAEVDVSTPDEAHLQGDVLDTVRASVDAVTSAQHSLSDAGTSEQDARSALEAAATRAKQLSESLEQYR